MTIRVRLALSFGLTLVLFCMNLVAYFVTSSSKDASLARLRTAAERRVQWGALESELRNRWQEIAVLSELPLTPGQSAEVERRLTLLAQRLANANVFDADMGRRWHGVVTQYHELQKTWRGGAAGENEAAVLAMLKALDGLKSEEDMRVANEATRLTDLTALMHRLSVAAFGLSLAAALFIALAFSRYLTNELSELQAGAVLIGAGDLKYRLAQRSDDELGQLAKAFNEMAAKLAHAMQEVMEARARAEHASRAKSAFLANMSHELRTPLLAVQGYAELVREEAERLNAEQIRSDATQIESAGRHLATLLNEVLDLSKIESGKLTFVIEEFGLEAVVDMVSNTVKPLITQNDNTLSTRIEPGAETMHGDEMKVRQILLNILGNAAKFTTGGDITLTVTKTEIAGEEVMQFIARDTGIGMTPEQTSRIFEEFEQAEPTTARAYGGSGLGLAICKKLSRLMGGDVVVTSQLARGTTFTITLPRRPRREFDRDGGRTRSHAEMAEA
jgi:signal transduction histidine kinase